LGREAEIYLTPDAMNLKMMVRIHEVIEAEYFSQTDTPEE